MVTKKKAAQKPASKKSAIKKPARKPWRVGVCYPSQLYLSSDLDSKIEKAAGVSCDGSGMGMGGRDMDFTFPTEKEADAAIKRIKKVHAEISADSWEDED